MTDILPCPFCGGSARLEDTEHGYKAKLFVECNECASKGPTVEFHIYYNCPDHDCRKPFEQKAINGWNIRTNKETNQKVHKKVYCSCCAKQVVYDQKPSINNQYITKGEGAKAGFGNDVICGYCAEQLDENGMFPEEQGQT